MHKISVIVPVYNVEQFLPECLDSIINQTHRDLEIIVINDGSTDSCPQICDDYGEKDERIRVIHKENGGLSNARNKGLNFATGNYISFVDSDDLLSLDFYQIGLKVLIENKVDIVECGFCKFESVIEVVNSGTSNALMIEIFKTEKMLELLLHEYLKQIVCNKIYRKEVIGNLRFPVNKINEDEFWTYKVFGQAEKIVKIPHQLYFYRQRTDSIMGLKYSLKRLDGLEAIEERIFYMKKNFPNLENLAIKAFSFGSMFHYQQIFTNQQLDQENILKRKLYLTVKEYSKWSIIKKWHWKDIIWHKLFLYSPKYYIKLRNLQEVRIKNRTK